MRYALIEDNTVTNIIEAEGADALPGLTLLEALPTTDIGDVLVDGALPQPLPPPPATLEDKAAHLATVRWAAEQGGTVWRDYTLQTDDRSQAKYLAELAAIDQGVRDDPSPWKLTEGFALLSNADIKAMAIAARAHVMACFAAEAAVQSGLADLPTLDAVATAFATALAQIKEPSHG